MFWDKWIPEKYLTKSEVCGVEVCYSDEGVVFNYIVLKRKSKKLSVSDSGKIFTVSEFPPSILKKKIPVIVVLNGKGIILKKTGSEAKEDSDLDNLIKENLPAINPDDFFIQFYKQEDGNGFLALCRKSQLEPLLEELKQKKYDVARIMIGAPAILGVKPLWNDFRFLSTSLHTINLANDSIESLVPKAVGDKEDQVFGDISIPAAQMLSFAGTVSYLLHLPVLENHSAQLQKLHEVHVEKNKFRFLLVCVIATAFLLATVNVAFFSSFYDTNNKLETELAVYQGKYDQVNQVLTDYQNNKSLIENVGILDKNKLSEYADKIAGTIPDDVVLSELYFNPRIEDVDQTADSLVTFAQKTIVMKGNCNRSFTINEWINVLKMQAFIKDVSLEKFVYNNDGLIPNYEIKLITK